MPDQPTTSTDLQAAFRRDGVIHLPQLLEPEWLELAQLGFRRNLAHPGPYAARPYAGTSRELYLDYCNWGTIPEFRILLQDSPIVDVVASVLGSESLWLFFDQVWHKSGGLAQRTPWHQDATVWITGGTHVCGFWITFEHVPPEESLEFVRGSHLGPLYAGITMRDADDDTAPMYPDSHLPRLPDIQADRDAYDIVSFPNEPGDVVMFHPAVLHGGGASANERRTLSLRFFGDDVVYEPRPGKASPPFPGVDVTVKPGQPLRSSWFPQVRPRPASIW